MIKRQKEKGKRQKYNAKLKTFTLYLELFTFSFLLFTFPVCAKEITILYTGDTHAMLYPCNCPLEPDGGVARRASLVKLFKKENPYTLLLDSGGFFAGGLMDEYTQNTQLDMQRTSINIKAMELMKYDAASIGDDEFNFGKEFLEENIAKIQIPILSCNISSDNLGGKPEKILPYLIKEVAGTKIGIVGVTNLSAMQKAGGLKFTEPKLAVKQAVENLKKNGTGIIVLLSHLEEIDGLRLIKEIDGIDILITGHKRSEKKESSEKVGTTLILRPSRQGRGLGKLSLTVIDNKITGYKAEELRISDTISDDPDVLSILPRCFSDTNCRKEGLTGTCEDPGNLKSRCIFNEVAKINLLIISPKTCVTCDTERPINFLKKSFPGLTVSYLYYPDTRTDKLIRDFGIKGLPVYLLGKEVEKEKGFDNFKRSLEIKGDFYMLKPEFSGFSYFLERKKMKGRIDLFLSLYHKDSPELLKVMKKFNPVVHFLATEKTDVFDASKGNLEVEEYLRAVCVQKYHPQSFWDYISCRAKNLNSSWWEDCATKLDTDKIKICAKGQEGRVLLKENISLNKELEIMFGPAYFLDNQEIFGSIGVPSEEELRKIFKK